LDLIGNAIQVESFSEPGVFYTVDIAAKTCTCPAFKKRKTPCKHMRGHVVSDKVRKVTPGRAMSGLIKSQRLRWEYEAVKYAVYLWRIPDQKFRLIRRVMIMAGEDNISLYTMERTSAWRRDYANITLVNLCAQVMRLCRTPNWYADEGGVEYIRAFRRCNALNHHKVFACRTEDEKYLEMAEAVRSGDMDTAVAAWEALYAGKVNAARMCQELTTLATELGKEDALRTLAVYRDNLKDLSADGNYTGQALIRLFQPVGSDELQAMEPKITLAEVKPLIAKAIQYWDTPSEKHFPSYFADGVHTDGDDERFAGTIRAMWGMCLAHRNFGRLHPDDQWPNTFWSYP
jgi:hypothetical protein